ncbi:MAG: bifunctional 5,10-methylenetetrahydrofolate dehydrogenase/5,10-methenyltetrahydrofolate cyclohydrolase [bacterium]|nr:bifunctional 5,10-methylenetetrahydrofolate dehydrogenase/5,10-methenyltetrahydrofolate cyclohydrolase [bacterium]
MRIFRACTQRAGPNTITIMVINGKRMAQDVIGHLKALPRPDRFLVAIVARTDEATQSFIRQKERTAHELGINFRVYQCSGSVTTDEVAGTVLAYVADPACGGIVIQLPLPPQVSLAAVLAELPVEKDVDAIGEQAIRALAAGTAQVLPPAVGTVRHIILSILGIPQEAMPGEEDGAVTAWLSSRRVAILGRGILVGQPVARWLEGKVPNLTTIDVGDDHSPVRDADLVVSGMGQAGGLKPNDLRPGTTVIDFGYSKVTGNEQEVIGKKISGDLDTSELQTSNLQRINFTPTPGGTGPILVAQLFENFYELNQ